MSDRSLKDIERAKILSRVGSTKVENLEAIIPIVCLRCGWYGWSNKAHICEFGDVMPAMNDMMLIAPDKNKIEKAHRQELSGVLDVARAAEFNLVTWAETSAQNDSEQIYDDRHKGQLRIRGRIEGFHKALELVMEELRIAISSQNRPNKDAVVSLYWHEIKQIISKLKGE